MEGEELMAADRIAGYTYQAETLCPECTVNAVADENGVAAGFDYRSASIERWLTELAARRGIDYLDERSYDSGVFPKVVFSVQVEGPEHCGRCGVELI